MQIRALRFSLRADVANIKNIIRNQVEIYHLTDSHVIIKFDARSLRQSRLISIPTLGKLGNPSRVFSKAHRCNLKPVIEDIIRQNFRVSNNEFRLSKFPHVIDKT